MVQSLTTTATKLKNNPPPIKQEKPKEAPIQTAYKYLTVTEGETLELMTRTNPTLAKACHLGYIFNTTIAHDDENGNPEYGNPYVAGYIEMQERLAVSMAGKGRQELIDALGQGGKLPDSFYEKKESSFIVRGSDQDD